MSFALPFFLMVLTAALPLRAQEVRIALVGDSTVNDEGGWGPGFAASFGPPVRVLNHAKNGRSSKSFRDEGLWEPVLAAKPAWVLIQFGHNDCPGKGPERETNPNTTYRENLTRYVREAQAAGAKPVLVTSIVRRNFDAQGRIAKDCLVPFVEEVRALGPQLHVPVADLYALTLEQAEKLGPAKADTLGTTGPDGKPDRTHLGSFGQQELGVLAARELIRVVPELRPRFHELVSWNKAIGQPREWFGSPEAVRIADNLLLYQHSNGGWLKNIDMAMPLGTRELKKLREQQSAPGDTTIDNGSTWTQLQFLARVCTATKQERFADAFRRGFRYLLEAQYPNGGWPQFYPLRKGYYTHITYNDDAMVGVLETLRSVARRNPDYTFMADAERQQASAAVERGIQCILKTQVRINGNLTVWCAQHDENTLAPAKARSYELPSLSGSESVGIVRFLMDIDKPGPEVTRAIESAVAWFRKSQINGIRLDRKPEPGSPKGYDLAVVQDSSAPPLWARFYELETNRPYFCGRDGIVKYNISEIEYERRNGYRWYVDRPAKLLSEDYPRWRKRISATP